MKEILFSYNNKRCHAAIVEGMTPDALIGDERYIGKMDGYEIYQMPSVWFDQFGFIAIAE